MSESSGAARGQRRRGVLRLTDEQLRNLQLSSDQLDLLAAGHHHHDDSDEGPVEPEEPEVLR
jgi:hypothetical protein